MKKQIFITGASGCVGHYVFERLVANPQYHLHLLVRNPARLMFNPQHFTNVSIVHDEMKNIARQADLLKEMDCLVHLAAGWGETELNYDYTLEMFNLLDPQRCQKVLYFSTASILTGGNRLFEEAEGIATSYIRGKFLCYRHLPKLKIYDRIKILFPTWVLGGDTQHPYSHATIGIMEARKWLWLLRLITADVRFHFIHAYDMATVVEYLLKKDVAQKEFVLGNPVTTAEAFIDELCRYYKVRRSFLKINLSPLMLDVVMFFMRKKLHAWDKYCIQKRHFEYNVTNPQSLGMVTKYPSLSKLLKDLR